MTSLFSLVVAMILFLPEWLYLKNKLQLEGPFLTSMIIGGNICYDIDDSCICELFQICKS